VGERWKKVSHGFKVRLKFKLFRVLIHNVLYVQVENTTAWARIFFSPGRTCEEMMTTEAPARAIITGIICGSIKLKLCLDERDERKILL
jgi:hypothetical protein